MIEKAGKYSHQKKAPIDFNIAIYPYAESSWYTTIKMRITTWSQQKKH